jgi:membrane protein YqaA with SNARE-associated domain
VRAFFASIFGYFLSPLGVVLFGALDASLIFFLPLGIDFVVILLSAREPGMFWLYAVLAALGSVMGAAGTLWLGRKMGEHGISRFVRPSTLKRVEERVSHQGAVAIAALGVIPPPFPFTAFVLVSGAFRANVWTFLATLAAVRVTRFGIEAALAAHYGQRIIRWMESTTFTVIVIALAALAIGGTIVSAVAIYRSIQREKRQSRVRHEPQVRQGPPKVRPGSA